jgi:hypothetical protein
MDGVVSKVSSLSDTDQTILPIPQDEYWFIR